MTVSGDKPTPELLEENKKTSLLDISMDSNKELWLFQWPPKENPDFHGKVLTLKLHGDGILGSFEASGKSYELVSFASQQPEATVFQSSESGSKIVGKISRRVSLIQYPEPMEAEESKAKRHAQFYQRSVGASSSGYRSASRGSRQRSRSGLSHVTVTPTPTRSSKPRSSLVESSSKRSQDSVGKDQSGVTSVGSAGHSEENISKKRKHE